MKLWALSPPVPTISNTSIPVAAFTAWARIAAAHPDISSVVSALALFVERAERNAAFCVGVVSPLMISFITVYASSYVRSSLFTIFTIASLIMAYISFFIKFFSICLPSGVMMDSGWNCTPKIGYSLCCTAITSPSSATAVTRSSSGMADASAARE